MNHKNCNILFIVLVLVVLAIPIFTMNLLPDQVSTIENRKLAELPSLTRDLTVFMNGVDSYVDDRIGFRDTMMQLYNRWNYSILKGNHSKVISGKDGWLFYQEELADYTGTNVVPAKTTGQVQILTAIDQWCKDRGITFVLAIGPNKATIYDNHMPDSIYHAPTSNLDMLLAALKETDVNVFCPKDALLAHRDDLELYFRQDTHWNSYGSRYLLDEMVDSLGLPVYDISVTESRTSAGDLLTMLGTGANEYTSLYTNVVYAEGAYTESIKANHFTLHSPDTASFVCYRDSYTIAMVGYYSYYFNGPVHWQYNIDFDNLEETRPQYLILSCVERYLDPAINANAGIVKRLASESN